jgi:hypothetical protein
VHYNSVPLMREKMAANVRNVTDVEVSDNIIDFLRLMGYQFQVRHTRHTTHDTRHTTHDTRHTTHDTRHDLGGLSCHLTRACAGGVQFEFIREGFVFQTQRKITVSVTQVKKVTRPPATHATPRTHYNDNHTECVRCETGELTSEACWWVQIVDREDLSTAEPLVAGTWFVELSARTDGMCARDSGRSFVLSKRVACIDRFEFDSERRR